MSVSVHKPHPAKRFSKTTAQLRPAEGNAPPHAARAVTGRPPHAAKTVTARAPHAAAVTQRRSAGATVQRMDGGARRPALCRHCNAFLPRRAVLEDAHVKVMTCIFKSSLYVLAKEHRETDTLEAGIAHLHRTVAIAEKLGWKGITHVVMNIGPTKKKRDNSYEGYEHFHAFIVFDPTEKTLERKFQDCTGADWASETSVGTVLHGHLYQVAYGADDPYAFAVEEAYEEHRMPAVNGLRPAYFSLEFQDGKAKTARWAI
jgi:hypothetical protein